MMSSANFFFYVLLHVGFICAEGDLWKYPPPQAWVIENVYSFCDLGDIRIPPWLSD